MSLHHRELELILGNSNRRFSGVTSTMLQVLPHQQKIMPLAVMGKHNLPKDAPQITFRETIKLCKTSRNKLLFHARRNDEMIQAVLLKKLFGANLSTVFTSTAQRHHSKFTKWLMSHMDAIISTCNAANSYLDTPADIIIPHGIDTSTFFPAEDKMQAWKDTGLPGKYGIGIFGRVRHQKGHDILIDAMIPILKENPDPTIVIIGETTPKHQDFLNQQLNKLEVHNLRDRVTILEKQPFSQIPKLFRAMSLVAALSRNEGFGLTPLEAMASGTAVLTSEAGAWKDIVRDDIDGKIVPCDDVNTTTQALQTLLQEPENLIQLGNNGAQHIQQNYTVEKEAQSLCHFFKTLIES